MPKTNSGQGSGVMADRNLFNIRKIYTAPYAANQAIVVNLTQQGLKAEFLRRITVKLTGSVNQTVAGAGATGVDNPTGLLLNATLTTSPVVQGLLPVNQVSGRSVRMDNMLNQGFFSTLTAIPNTVAVHALDSAKIHWDFLFNRRIVRKGIQYDVPCGAYTGLTMTMTFGDLTTIWGAGAAGSFASANVEIWAESDYNVQTDYIHAHEFFEQVYTVSAANAAFFINNLQPGYLYTDLGFVAEVANVPTDGLITNIDIESSGNIWTPAGDTNADTIQLLLAGQYAGGVDLYGTGALAGLYAVPIWDGMWSRAMNFINSAPLVKLNMSGACTVRVFGRRMIPGALRKPASGPGSAAAA